MATGSLLGKADTTLVQAAYKASAAGAPPDLSGIHERLALAHSKTMKSIGDVWVKGISLDKLKKEVIDMMLWMLIKKRSMMLFQKLSTNNLV